MATSEERVFKKADPIELEVPELVARTIASVMRDRSKMKVMELDLDTYLNRIGPRSIEKKEEIRKQLTDGRLALESLLQRFLSS